VSTPLPPSGTGAEPAFDAWLPDPFGRHEHRHFFLGQPTSLVRDGDTESYDPVGPLLAAAGVAADADELTVVLPVVTPAESDITQGEAASAHDTTDAPASTAPPTDAAAAPVPGPMTEQDRWSPVAAIAGLTKRRPQLSPAATAVVVGAGAILVSFAVAAAFGAVTAPPPLKASSSAPPSVAHPGSSGRTGVSTSTLPPTHVATAPASAAPPATIPTVSVATTVPVTTTSTPAVTPTTLHPCPSGSPQATVYMRTTAPASGATAWTVSITGSATNAASDSVHFDYAAVQIVDAEGEVVATVDASPNGGPTVLAPDQSVGLSYSGTVDSPDRPHVGSVTTVWEWATQADSGCPT
jgi:hypothetical protein